ncbi:CAMP-RESPONSE ELEMENT BINDING PROTEIN-RELATED [Salix purpurea]|uniref:cAMP-RESPONSE ELEMENT BINDING PROTEIN-RELATED n=1 Tax=Salix purpurea TaxID=77065 RepID=A0A9Q0Q448_SALPP|nr:CAMP-RESPONSE ELEMENT BINDING PROTEIN-RELATED [Salix purpurea]
MVVTESELNSQSEVESPLQPDQQQAKNHPLSSLCRQSSIYSLTLDEFQHTLCESGRNFGSMNMDEFLANIWTAEENQATATSANMSGNNQIIIDNNASQVLKDPYGHRGQHSLPRQDSLSLPAPLCRKTVDEVWSEIQKGQTGGAANSGGNVQNPKTAPHQATFGEMTLEDFLIKAGVVREQCTAPFQQQQRGLYESNNNKPAVATGFVARPVLGMATGGGVMHQGFAAPIGESPGRSGGYELPAASTAAVYGGRAGNGGGYGQGHGVGTVAPLSPMSSDGMVTNFDNSGNQFGMDMGGLRGRERIIDGPVEKVAERRQRRMIKNRESAARSRARKQAYTVELEAELNQLKEENKQLQHALAELERKRKQQCFEEPRMKAHTKARKTKEKLRLMRRNSSCSLF